VVCLAVRVLAVVRIRPWGRIVIKISVRAAIIISIAAMLLPISVSIPGAIVRAVRAIQPVRHARARIPATSVLRLPVGLVVLMRLRVIRIVMRLIVAGVILLVILV